MDLFCPFSLVLELCQKLSERLNIGCSCCVCVKSVTSTSYLDEICLIMKVGGVVAIALATLPIFPMA